MIHCGCWVAAGTSCWYQLLVRAGTPPAWSDCAGLSPELRLWRLQFGNLSIYSDGRLWRHRTPLATALQLVVPPGERRGFIQPYHESVFAGHLGIYVFLLNQVYWHGLSEDVRSYLESCSVCLARKSPCSRRAPMGHVSRGHRWDTVAMDILDISVTTVKGNRYVLVIVDCFSRWTNACPLPSKMAVSIADAFFQLIICHFGMPTVIHSDHGREIENHIMVQESPVGSALDPDDSISSGKRRVGRAV